MARPCEETAALIDGLLAFVNTPFTDSGEVDIPRFRRHLHALEDDYSSVPSSYFCCCGTGEFWSLDLAEYTRVVRAAVDETGSRAPVIAGVGYGTRLAIEYARAARESGADGLLVFPPYLASGPQAGLIQHYGAIAAATDLGVVVYNRDNAVFEPRTVAQMVSAHPNVIGLKDGHGDMASLQKLRGLLGETFLILNGMPSAEMYAWDYTVAGFRPYSPGGIEFVPEIAWAFDRALERGDRASVDRWIEAFFRPYTELRNQVSGYGISLVKAGLLLRGRPVGGVRPPLVDPTPDHVEQLAALIDSGLCLLADLETDA